MSGQVLQVNDPDLSEPPPPYSVAMQAESNAQDKTHGIYPTAPSLAYPPADLSQDTHTQIGGYPMQPGYPSQPGYPLQAGYSSQPGYPSPPGYPLQPGYPVQAAYAPPSQFTPQHPGSYYAPPPSGYGTAHTQQPGSTVILQQPLLAPAVPPFQTMPVRTICPKCRASVVTITVYVSGTLSWLICAVLCLVGCDAGCCLIPFCTDSCKDVMHFCPNCHQSVFRFNRL